MSACTKGQGKHGNLLAEPLLLERESHLRRLSLDLCADVCVGLLAVADRGQKRVPAVQLRAQKADVLP